MLRAMCRPLVAVVAALALGSGCGEESVLGPFDDLPLDARFDVGLLAPVHVARDRYGVAHVRAQTLEDAAYVQGYVMAHDRLPQMDILRRFGAGTLSELFGALDPSVIDTDLEMRVHRMRPLAAEAWQQLEGSDVAVDREIVVLLQRFADGVNAYAAQIRTEANPAGVWDLDPNLLVSFDPIRFTPWHPIDSLVLGRFQAFALSWTTPIEIDLTELSQFLAESYDAAVPGDPELFARRGLTRDFLRFTPVGQIPTIEGFPNTPEDGRTRSDGSAPDAQRTSPVAGVTAASPATATRPRVPDAVFARARSFFARGTHTGPLGALGPHAFMAPYAGSNNWAVSAAQTGTDTVMLASDQHLQLPNPSIFYPTHVTVAPPDEPIEGAIALARPLDTMGITFPGIPGVVLGTNGNLAWAATVSYHDVNDVYLEAIVPCTITVGSCVRAGMTEVPLETFTEQIQIGALGTITETRTATYEVVPHHGPIIPEIDPVAHTLVPRTDPSALSVRYTGYQVTSEIRAIYALSTARTVGEGFVALGSFGYGSQNWTMIDNNLDLGWTTHAIVPVRATGATTWNADTNPGGTAPFFVLPGDGSAEWDADPMSARYIPHAINPMRLGQRHYLVTANADPVGATFDNDPLNQRDADDALLYAGAAYATGLRHERIATMLDEAWQTRVTLDDMARIQRDTRSNMGAKLAPYLRAVLARLDAPAGTPGDLEAYVAGLAEVDRTRLITARALLAGWSFATPTGLEHTGSITDSAATAVFNAWMHFFVERVFADELDLTGLGKGAFAGGIWRLDDSMLARIVHALVTQPGTFVQSPATTQPIVCDDVADPGADGSCDRAALEAMVAAMTHLEQGEGGFGTPDVSMWQWGRLHRLRIEPLFPNPELELPGPGEPGFPKPGDNFAVNRSDQGWGDLDFSQSADGPAQRFLATAGRGETIRVRWALPGGAIFDSRSPHYRDLLDRYYLPETHFDAPFQVQDIIATGEHRWLFR